MGHWENGVPSLLFRFIGKPQTRYTILNLAAFVWPHKITALINPKPPFYKGMKMCCCTTAFFFSRGLEHYELFISYKMSFLNNRAVYTTIVDC